MEFNAHDHQNFMQAALREAEQAGQAGENPIGAVIVHNGITIDRGRARHAQRHSEIAHAELIALLEAEKYIHDHIHAGVILYTTVDVVAVHLYGDTLGRKMDLMNLADDMAGWLEEA